MDFNLKKSWIDLCRTDSEQAWKIFINQFNQLIMNVIHKLVNDHDDSMEIYPFAIEQLKSDNCKKLTSYFTKSRPYNFETWVAIVIRNCCMDWFRKEKGRKRLLKCIESLPEIDQRIFKYIYWHRYSFYETFNLLNSKHGYENTFEEMLSIIDRIEDILQKNTRWKLSHDWHSILPPLSLDSIETGKEKFSDHDPSPEEQLILENPVQILNEILKSLPPEQQLIIQTHYYHGYTLDKISRILKMKNLWRVRRKLEKVLKVLKEHLQKKGIGPADLELP